MTEALKKEIMDEFKKDFKPIVHLLSPEDEQYRALMQGLLDQHFSMYNFCYEAFLLKAIDKSFRAGVEACKLYKTGYVQHMSSRKSYYEGNGYDKAVEDLEALKKELLTNP